MYRPLGSRQIHELKKVVLTPNESLKILLVEDDPAATELIKELLGSVSNTQFNLKAVARLGEGLQCLLDANFDAILLDLSLPDSKGLETIVSVKAHAPTVAIVVLTALNDQNIALEAVRCGAQDYLLKRQFETELLVRALRYAIERQRAQEGLRQQAERERLQGRMIERIRQSIDLKDILETTVAEVRQFLKTDRVLIYQLKPDGSGIVAVESVGSNWVSILGVNIIDNCFKETYIPLYEQNRILGIDNIQTAGLSQCHIDLLSQFQIKANLIVPILQNSADSASSIKNYPSKTRGLISGIRAHSRNKTPRQNRLWGLLVANHCSDPRQWQQWEMDFLKQLAAQVAIAIQQSELYRQLEIANQKLHYIAITDGLTGIANRRRFDEVLLAEWRRLTREQAPLSIILCDIDFFKLYNDRYGHLAGDICLQQISHAIAISAKRPADLVARYGGEEFAAILPRTDAAGASIVAQAIRTKIKKLKIPHGKSPVNQYVTLSLGIASTIPCYYHSYETLIKAADTALYEAKNQGRDRIVVAS